MINNFKTIRKINFIFYTLLLITPGRLALGYTKEDVRKHFSPQNCWMIIDEKVYDISSYFDQHPAPSQILSVWCGKEATQAWKTKGKNKPHSKRAELLLKKYYIGDLKAQ